MGAAADALLAATSDYAVSVFDPRLASLVRAALAEGAAEPSSGIAPPEVAGGARPPPSALPPQQRRRQQQLAAFAAEAAELAAAEAELGQAMARLRSLLRPERPSTRGSPAADEDGATRAAPAAQPPPPEGDGGSDDDAPLPPLQAVQRLFGRLLAGARVVMAVHNGGYQGEFGTGPGADVRRLGLPDKAAPVFDGTATGKGAPPAGAGPVASAQRALACAMETLRAAMRGLIGAPGAPGPADDPPPAQEAQQRQQQEEEKQQQPGDGAPAAAASAPPATSAPAPAPAPAARVNWLRGGLLAADAVVTVSPEYARELAGLGSEAAAAGSDAAVAAAVAAALAEAEGGPVGPSGLPRDVAVVLRARGVAGILNGLDAEAWDPSTDPMLPAAARFTAETAAEGKAAAKLLLRRRLGLLPLPGEGPGGTGGGGSGGDDAAAASARVPLVAYIGRFESQKGVDVLLAALPALLGEPSTGPDGRTVSSAAAATAASSDDAGDDALPPSSPPPSSTPGGDPPRMQLVVLGRGQPWTEGVVGSLARRYPGRAAGVPEFSEPLAHLLLAAADYLVVPSRFEPCGLVALAALRYGCPPVAARTGGLVDIVTADVGYTFEAPPAAPPTPPGAQAPAAAAAARAAPDFRRAVAALAGGLASAVGEYGTAAYASRRVAGMARAVSWEEGPARQWEALLAEVLSSSSPSDPPPVASSDDDDDDGK